MMFYKKLFCYTLVSASLHFTGCFTESSKQQSTPAGAEYLNINLAGKWYFRPDPDGLGREQKWFEHTGFENKINLPGSMAENGFGDDVTTDTKWTGSMWNNAWRTEDKYKKNNGKLDRHTGYVAA